MKKLRLESIEVTSFETSPAMSRQAGTVRGQQEVVPVPPSRFAPCYPTDPNFDCTYGCSQNTACPEYCLRLTDSVECA
jgi:hypothetical protein